jgi:hypothetical protein
MHHEGDVELICKQTMKLIYDFVMASGELAASEFYDISVKSVRRYVRLYRQYFEIPNEESQVQKKLEVCGATATVIHNELSAREFADVNKDLYDTRRIDVNFRPDGTSQYKISFVPKEGSAEITAQEYADQFSEFVKGWTPPVFPQYVRHESELLATVSVADWHHGKQVWGNEISGKGENWDIHESRDAFEKYISYAIDVLSDTMLDTVVIEAHGDFFNVDNVYNTTLSGTQQSEDSRFIKTQCYAENMMVNAIAGFRALANRVVVLIVPGNHDATRILLLGRYLEAFFRNDSGVEVMCDPTPRKKIRWGRTLLAYSHEMKGNVVQSMFSLWPEDCGQCKDLVMNVGHLHQQKELCTTLMYEQYVRIVQHPAMVPRDAWSDSEGYAHVRGGLIRVFDKRLGQISEYMYHPHFSE